MRAALSIFLLASIAVFGMLALSHQSPAWKVARDAVLALTESAHTMDVELAANCIAAIEIFVSERGFQRGVVTARGHVMIRDAQGVDEWVCR